MQLPWHSKIFTTMLLSVAMLTDALTLPSQGPYGRRSYQLDVHQTLTERTTKFSELAVHKSSPLTSRIEPMAPFQHFFLDIGNGWNMFYSSWHSSMVPVAPAAWALSNIYASVLVQAQSTWRKGPPSRVIKANVGPVQLLMICVERPIPWDFVEKFSQELLRMTTEGWTGLYQVLLTQAVDDVSIGVELSIIPVV